MEAFDAILTKIEVREFEDKPVSDDVKKQVLEAARATGSSNNSQHWRFILIQDKDNLKRLADDSITGKWVGGANFAVIIVTNPKVGAHMIDAGRAIQDMQLAAWSNGLGSGIFTRVDVDKVRQDFKIPQEMQTTAFLGFGYPKEKITGKKKNRRALGEIVFLEQFGSMFDETNLKHR